MSKPDWVACALRAAGDDVPVKTRETWCGRVVDGEWVFLGVDHALLSKKRGRTLLCPQCAQAVRSVLRSLYYRDVRRKKVAEEEKETDQQKKERVAREMARAYYGDPD